MMALYKQICAVQSTVLFSSFHKDHCGGGPKTGGETGTPAACGPCIPVETVMTVPGDVLKQEPFHSSLSLQ